MRTSIWTLLLLIGLGLGALPGPARADTPCFERSGDGLPGTWKVSRVLPAVRGVPDRGGEPRLGTDPMYGAWSGTGLQSTDGTAGADGLQCFSIKLLVAGAVGTIDYPTIDCGGVLTRTATPGDWARYTEHITYGDCIDGGDIAIRMDGSRLFMVWSGRDEGHAVRVTAILRK